MNPSIHSLMIHSRNTKRISLYVLYVEFYCTVECQRAHWSTHKTVCVKVPKSPTKGPLKVSEAFEQLRALKEKQQKAMQQNNTKSAIEIGKQALNVAIQLSGPVVDNELAQLYHNLSHLCTNDQPPDREKAEEYGRQALKHSELDLKQASDNPSSLDLHSVILIAQANRRLEEGKFDAAEKATMRALEIAEEIFGNDDARLVKALRACAMLRERQENLPGACAYLRRAYECCLKQMGMMHPGVQQILDEYVMILTKSEKVDEALPLAQRAYDEVSSKSGPDSDIATDCASRLTTLLVKKGQLDEAEKMIQYVVDVRTKKFGPGNLHVAAAVASLGHVREQKGLYDAQTEGYLREAYRVFRSELGPGHPNARQCIAQVNAVRKKRIELGQKVEDEALEEENMLSKALKNARSDAEKVQMMMNHGTMCFKEGKFKQAEPILEDAVKLAEKEFGPQHQATKAAIQNLQITRNNIVLQLWQEIVDEEKAKIDERRKNGETSWDTTEEFTILGNL